MFVRNVCEQAFDGLVELLEGVAFERAAIRVLAGERQRGLGDAVAILRKRAGRHERLRVFDGFDGIMRQHALIEGLRIRQRRLVAE